jgi:DNA-binding IclR family transcriptional regulator
VEKAATVIASFPPGGTCVGVSELARRCGLAKSTTHRTLQILRAIGMVERGAAGYRLGHRLQELAEIAGGRAPSRLRDCVLPYLLELYEETHLTIHLGVWSGPRVLIVENLHGHHYLAIPPQVGTRAPVHCTALGKVLLAHADEDRYQCVMNDGLRPFTQETITTRGSLDRELETVRQEGIAFSWNEYVPATVHVAAPLWGPGRAVTAAISVSGPEDRFDVAVAARHVRRIAHAASVAPCAREVPA